MKIVGVEVKKIGPGSARIRATIRKTPEFMLGGVYRPAGYQLEITDGPAPLDEGPPVVAVAASRDEVVRGVVGALRQAGIGGTLRIRTEREAA